MEKNNFISKLSEACSSDDLRPVLQCVNFQNGYAYASDAHTVIKQSLDLSSVINSELLNGNSIHKDSFDAIRKFEHAEATVDGIACKNDDGNNAFFPYYDLKGQPVPDFDAVIKKELPASVEFIGMNLEIVKKCLSALYCSESKQFKFHFSGISKPITVTCIDVEDQVGIIMPVMLQTNMFNQ